MRIWTSAGPWATVCAVFVAGFATPSTLAEGLGRTTALEEYVYRPDPAFAFVLQESIVAAGYTAHILLMDSLRWRDGDDVDRTLWSHQLIVIVPDEVTHRTALMVVDGGSDPTDPPDPLILNLSAAIAISTGSVLAAVSQIPNQPLLFPDEASPISEDTLVAYSWDKAMATGDGTWAAYMPMVKATVRGLDAVQSFVNDSVAGVEIDDFVVTGFSKRGATAWLVAATDPRVRAVAPGVFDVLDFPIQIERHYRAYGFYSDAIEDYVDYDIVRRVRSPEGRFLTDIVDPLSYAATLHIPKLLLNATGDQFFLPDSAGLYVNQLPGETLVRQIPNTDHGFENGLLDALDALLSWYRSILDDEPRPQVAWRRVQDDVLQVRSIPTPVTASLWQATNPAARDFRLDTIGPVWEESDLAPAGHGKFEIRLEPPDEGYTGYLVELTFAGGPPAPTYTTPVFVSPDRFEFDVEDPVGTPRGPKYWACQLPDAPSVCPQPADYSPAELAALLPFPVFGVYVRDLDELADAFASTGDATDTARRACTGVRLNIAAGEIGWYSQVGRDDDTSPLWARYAAAEKAFAVGQPRLASRLCAGLGTIRPAREKPASGRDPVWHNNLRLLESSEGVYDDRH